MEYPEVKALLEKYWKADTTPEEEAALAAWFRQESFPPDLEIYRELFALYDGLRQMAPGPGLDEKIQQRIGERGPTASRQDPVAPAPMEPESRSSRPAMIKRMTGLWTRVAAVLILAAGLAGIYHYGEHRAASPGPAATVSPAAQPVAIADTYRDPKKAMAEVQKALRLMSGHLQHGERMAEKKLTRLKTLNKVVE